MNLKKNKTKITAVAVLLLVLISSTLSFVGCGDKKIEGGFGKSDEKSVFSCAYKSDKNTFDINDVTLTFYYGHHLSAGNMAYYSYPNFELYFCNDDNLEVLVKRIEDEFVSEKYHAYYGKGVNFLKSNIQYNHFETLTIPKELFTKDDGIIYFCIYGTNMNDDNQELDIITSRGIYYKKDGNKIVLSDEEFSESQIIKEIKMFFGK